MPDPAMRVFSHTCSNTEIVCALGCAGMLVGVDADSDYPPEVVADLPKTGRDLDLDIEAVLKLEPELVLTSLTVPGHERLVAEMEAAMPTVEPTGRRPRVLVEWWPKPVIAAARRSWVNDLIQRAGGSNPWGDVDAKSVPLELADAAAQRPDIVAMSWCGVKVENYRADKVRAREGWREVPAVANHHIHAISEAFLGRPGPRLVEGYRQLRAAIAAVE